MDLTGALAGFQARCDVAWQAGRSAVDATRLDADEETVPHLDWAMSNQARFRLRVLDGEKLPGDPGHTRPTAAWQATATANR